MSHAAGAQDRWVLDLRGPRPDHDPSRYQGLILENERSVGGAIARVATVFLTGRECPWRCVMCDLWKQTTTGDTPPGAIPRQLAAARSVITGAAPPVAQIKLYNAGSFFDSRAVPESDYDEVARLLNGFERVIVESHPALIGPRVDRFLASLDRHAPAISLEVAVGLETAHPEALRRLNKRMTVDDFASAAERLHARGVALRVFLLIAPPFVEPAEQDLWLARSVDVAASCGATAMSLIPTRAGNGAMERLAREGVFAAPSLSLIEHGFDASLEHVAGRARVFVDLWELDRFSSCVHCFDERRARLHAMNLEQRLLPRVTCDRCRR